jgi:hypothetical protein
MGLFWHFSDVVSLTGDVGSWGQSGLTADIAETTRLTPNGHRGTDGCGSVSSGK